MAQHSRRPARTLLVLGTAAFALAACEDNREDNAVFMTSGQDCQSAGDALPGDLSPEACERLLEDARQEHALSAPRYAAMDVCEAEHGEGNCLVEAGQNEGYGGSSIMPFVAGYMIGNMMSSSGQRSHVSRPMIPAGANRYATVDNSLKTRSLSGGARVSDRILTAKPAITRGTAPMTKATVVARGGFGGAATSGSAARSTGG